MAGMSDRFRARTFEVPPPRAQITGTVEPVLEVQAREVAPATSASNDRYTAFCVTLAIPICFAIGAVMAGDIRVGVILLLVALAITIAGLYTLKGTA